MRDRKQNLFHVNNTEIGLNSAVFVTHFEQFEILAYMPLPLL